MNWRRICNEAILAGIVLMLALGGYAAYTHRSRAGVRVETANYRAVAKSDSDLADLLRASDLAGGAWDAALDGRFDDAERFARQCLKTDPTNGHALYALGLSEFHHQHYSQAATNFAAAADAGSDCRYRNALALAQAQLHDWNGAKGTMIENFGRFPNILAVEVGERLGNDHSLSSMEKLAANFPGQAVAHYLYGVTLVEEQKAQESLQELTRATQLDPALAAAFLARAALRHQLDDTQGAFQDFSEVLRLEPNLSVAMCGRAEIEAARGDDAQAQSDFFSAVKYSDEPSFRSDTMVKYAEVCLRMREASEAMKALTAACAETPWQGLRCCAGQAEWGSVPENRAVLLYAQAIDLAETDPAQSLRLFQQSASLAPRWPMARLGVALENGRLNDFAAVAGACAGAVELEPKLSLGWFWKSTALSHLGMEGEAVAALQRAQDIPSKWTSPCTNLAGHEMARKEFAQAAARLTRLLHKFDDAGALRMRAQTRQSLHDEDGALLDLNRSLALEENSEARLERARILMARHQKRDAIADYIAVCRLDDSQDAGAAEARQVVGKMTKMCERCGGHGYLSTTVTCPECRGAGTHAVGRASVGLGRVGTAGMLNNCGRCGGSGQITENLPCPECNGLGVIF